MRKKAQKKNSSLRKRKPQTIRATRNTNLTTNSFSGKTDVEKFCPFFLFNNILKYNNTKEK